MINENSYGSDVANELGLIGNPYGNEVAGEVGLTSAAYGNEVATAINERPTGTLRVVQYNIGHFNMGSAPAPTGNNPSSSTVLINSSKSDGYPSSLDRNYSTQLSRWTSRISGLNADIIGIEEYNKYFGYNGGSVVTTTDANIFDGFTLSIGRMGKSLINGNEQTNGWQWNALASKYAMSNAADEELGSTGNNIAKCYAHYARVTIDGKSVLIASTHLHWAQNSDAVTSRALEIQHLVNWLDDEPYFILMGDFNTDGIYVASGKTEQQYMAGVSDFSPFVEAGFTLANHGNFGDLKTCTATNSRPDIGASEPFRNRPYCYLDNIITKGFTMSNVRVIDDGTITDHCGVVADLTLIDS